LKLATAMSRLGTETAFEVLVKAQALEAKGVHVIHLEIGEPDFPTPDHIIEAGIAGLREGLTKYCASQGVAPLREAIAIEAGSSRGITVDPATVVVTPGAKPIMFYSIMALVDPGDEVIYPDPGFPIYRSMISFVGGIPVPLPLRQAREFRFDVEELKAKVSKKTKMIILNTPHNPTGGALEKEDLEEIARLAIENDIVVLADEVYRYLQYEGSHFSIASLPGMPERTIILDGFSKTYSMTGWRLGYGVFPPDLVGPITKLVVNSVSCTPPFIQKAGLAALKGSMEPTQKMAAEFKRRRDLIVDGLNSIPGIKCLRPRGAFYVFPDITGTGMKSREFETYLLQNYGVAALSGTAFGEYGEGHIRFSYANSYENIEIALERVAKAVADLGK